MRDLGGIAAELVAPGKGILAADESVPVMPAPLAGAGAGPSGIDGRAYQEMLVTTPTLPTGISGVILHPQTWAQRMADGTRFPAAVRQRGMLPGVKADKGLRPLPGCPGETITEGLDRLWPRLQYFASSGAVFAAWRAVLRIGPGTPSLIAVRANAEALGRYASACQQAGLVPVVQAEVLTDGSHSLAHCEAVTSIMLLAVVTVLQEYDLALDSVLLAPSLVSPGSQPGAEAPADKVAEATLAALACLPAALAGVTFLSGGQRPQQATASLAALQAALAVWPLTFCFGHALTGPAMAAWQGTAAGVAAGQRALARRTALNVAALERRYVPGMETGPEPAHVSRLGRMRGES